jgi:methionyl-tRNA formyltransferase
MMDVVFMGTPDFAVPSLLALHAAGHRIRAVVCQPDRPAGRGLKLTAPPVKQRALELALPVLQPVRMKDPALAGELSGWAPDVIVVAAYGRILPRPILDVPRQGCINVHASLLPRLRGACPIHRAILEGEPSSGVTIMRMDEGMDTGAMLLWEEVPLSARETAGTLHDRLAALGSRLIVQALARLEAGTLEPVAQDPARATLAPKLPPGIGQIDWSLPAVRVDRLIRGVTPAPGAYTFLGELRVRILEAEPHAAGERAGARAAAPPGTIVAAHPEQGLLVSCGEGGVLRLVAIQPEGRRPQSAREFLAGHRLRPGDRLGRTAAGVGAAPDGAGPTPRQAR